MFQRFDFPPKGKMTSGLLLRKPQNMETTNYVYAPQAKYDQKHLHNQNLELDVQKGCECVHVHVHNLGSVLFCARAGISFFFFFFFCFVNLVK